MRRIKIVNVLGRLDVKIHDDSTGLQNDKSEVDEEAEARIESAANALGWVSVLRESIPVVDKLITMMAKRANRIAIENLKSQQKKEELKAKNDEWRETLELSKAKLEPARGVHTDEN